MSFSSSDMNPPQAPRVREWESQDYGQESDQRRHKATLGRVRTMQLQDGLGGSLGYFWRFQDWGDASNLRAGYLRQLCDQFEVELLRPVSHPGAMVLTKPESAPDVLIGQLTTGIATQFASATERGVFATDATADGGLQGLALVNKLDRTEKLKSPKPLFLTMRFPDVLSWAGLVASSTDLTFHKSSNRTRSTKIELHDHGTSERARIEPGLSLELRSRLVDNWQDRGTSRRHVPPARL